MTLPSIPSKNEPLVDSNRQMTLPWSVFMEDVADGDAGTSWTPTFVNLTEVGTATKTGIYYRLNRKLLYYRIVITPATSTSSTSGSTYCNNFPLTTRANSANITINGSTAGAGGSTALDNRIYPASWSAITTPITIIGMLEVI